MAKSRDYKKEYREFQGKPDQIKRRSSRNKARRKLVNSGVKVAGRDVDHRDGNPMNNSRGNLHTMSASANRSKK